MHAASIAAQEPFERINSLLRDCLPGLGEGALPEAELEKLRSQFETLNNGFPLVHGILNFATNKYIYLTDNVTHFDGEKEQMMEEGLPYILQLFHPDERRVVAESILPDLIRFLGQSHSEAKLSDARAAFTSRLRLRSGEYRWYLHQMSILKTDTNNAPLLGLKLLMEIGGIKHNHTLDLVLSLKDGQDVYHTVRETSYPIPQSRQGSLSKREMQVLKLIAEGKTSKQIAALLHISEHTVNNHRKNMLRKKEVSSTPELVLGATTDGLF